LEPSRRYDGQAVTEHAVFSEFFSDEVINGMVIETNRYASQLKAQPNLPANARIRFYRDTDANEMRAFIALRIAMGLTPRPTVQYPFFSRQFILAY
jgi:hypothetical protein